MTAKGVQIVQCGTHGGYKRHLRERTPTCQPCKDANNRQRREARMNVHVVVVNHGPRLADFDFTPRDWAQHAACVDADPEWFFADQPADQARALEYCRRCPVAVECLQEGVRSRSDGIWGGLTPQQMDRLLTRRGA